MFLYKPYDTGDQSPFGTDTAIRLGGSAGFSFTTNVTGVFHDVALFLADPTPSDGGTVTVSLYSDNGGQPGQLLDTLGTIRDSSLSTSGSLVDLPAPLLGAPQLTAGTEYWIVVSGSAASDAVWMFDSSDAGYGALGQSFDDKGTVHSNAQGAYIATVDESVQGSLSADYDTTGQAVAGTDTAI